MKLCSSLGECVCSQDWMGLTCSIPVSQPPALDIQDNIFCDISTDTCRDFVILGVDFVESPLLTCKWEQVTVSKILRFIHF